MSRSGSVKINLDDVFGNIGVEKTTQVNEPHTHSSSHSSVTTVRENPSVLTSHITTSTVTKVISSDHYPASTPKNHNLSRAESNDTLLRNVFNNVELPAVLFNSENHDDAIRQIDDVLQSEGFDNYDQESIKSEPSYRAPSSHVSSNADKQNPKKLYTSEYHPQNASSVYSNSSVKKNAAYHTADQITNNIFNGIGQNYSANGNEPNPDYEEERNDRFNSDHQYETDFVGKRRDRTNTFDSYASRAESRVGQFDVHDNNDQFTGDNINLYHNEVAYMRPNDSTHNSIVSSYTSKKSFHTGDTQRLKNIQRQVDDANNRRAQLSHQIDRQRAENDRLIQVNLAREVSLKVHGKPIGYSVRSYSQNGVIQHPQKTSTHSSRSVDSSIYEEEVKVSPLAAKHKASGEHIATHGNVDLIVPEYYVVENFSKNNRINKVVIGGDAALSDDDKTLLLFGPVGSGKTSTVTSMMNYLYDVKKENNFRFVLDEHVSSTTGLTAYVFNNTVLSYNVTVVDTPGVVNQTGNKTVSTLVKQWFEKELLKSGAFRLDAISIVLRHDEYQLKWPFVYELADIKKMFGDDLKTNVLPIITNSEVLPQPVAVRSLTQANISFLEYYKVNNAGFTPEPKGISRLQYNLYWTHGISSLENLFRDLQEQVHPLIAILRHNKGKKVQLSRELENKVLY